MRVGVTEARSRWGELLRRVCSGETVHITRRGKLIAKLIPDIACERADLKKVVEEIRELRKGAAVEEATIRELIEEGRRY
jgi:prevent-host-death family protein